MTNTSTRSYRIEGGVSDKQAKEDHGLGFMRSLRLALRGGRPAVLKLGASGVLAVYPQQSCYCSNVDDWHTVSSLRSDEIHIADAPAGPPPVDALPLEELEWRAALQCADEDRAVNYDLYLLKSWPNVTRLPRPWVQPAMRVCAVLWRKPTVGFLVARHAGLEALDCAAILRAMTLLGHVQSTKGRRVDDSVEQVTEQTSQASVPHNAGVLAIATLLWRRMMRMNG